MYNKNNNIEWQPKKGVNGLLIFIMRQFVMFPAKMGSQSMNICIETHSGRILLEGLLFINIHECAGSHTFSCVIYGVWRDVC